jgi:hypothetical protein
MIETNPNKPRDTFQQYSLGRLRGGPDNQLPDGKLPYHVYNGTVLLIGGTASLGSVQRLLDDRGLEPVCTTRNEGLVSLWVCIFTQSSLGPHMVLHAGISVALNALPPVEPRPMALLGAVLTMPQVGMYYQRTWVDEPRVAAYQSELLGLDVHLAQGGFSQFPSEGRVEFEFWDVNDGETLLSGQLCERSYTTPRSALALLLRLGLSGFLQVARRPGFSLQVVAPGGEGGPGGRTAARHTGSFRERVSQMHWNCQRAVTQFFNPHSDRLMLSSTVYREMEFHPQFIERLEGFKMVYLPPGNSIG